MQGNQMKVDFVGLDKLDLDSISKDELKSIAEKHTEKAMKLLNKDVLLKVHLKKHSASKELKEHKYTVTLHLTYTGSNISIDDVEDFDLRNAMQKAGKELDNRIRHAVKA